MNDTKPWYESKIILTQIVAIIFATAAIFRFDFGGLVDMDETGLVEYLMLIVGVATVIFRSRSTAQIAPKP